MCLFVIPIIEIPKILSTFGIPRICCLLNKPKNQRMNMEMHDSNPQVDALREKISLIRK